MKARERRIKIEWIKATIAFVVMIISTASADSVMCIIPMAIAILSLLYLRVVAIRLQKRGAY
jgi:hypothetical protein